MCEKCIQFIPRIKVLYLNANTTFEFFMWILIEINEDRYEGKLNKWWSSCFPVHYLSFMDVLLSICHAAASACVNAIGWSTKREMFTYHCHHYANIELFSKRANKILIISPFVVFFVLQQFLPIYFEVKDEKFMNIFTY